MHLLVAVWDLINVLGTLLADGLLLRWATRLAKHSTDGTISVTISRRKKLAFHAVTSECNGWFAGSVLKQINPNTHNKNANQNGTTVVIAAAFALSA